MQLVASSRFDQCYIEHFSLTSKPRYSEPNDCKEEKSRTLAFSWFSGQMGNGKVVYSDGNVRAEWEPIEPGSFGELQWKVACGKK